MNDTAFVKEVHDRNIYMEVYIDPFNKRIRIDDYRGSIKKIVDFAEELAVTYKSEKCIIIGRKEHLSILLEHDFYCEAMVDTFFNGSEAYYVTKYFTLERKYSERWILDEQLLKKVRFSKKKGDGKQHLPAEYSLEKISLSEAKDLAELYQTVFPIYPTPLHDPAYIEKTIKNGTIYYTYRFNGKIISAASAEINKKYHNAELTDCATLPEHRKFGLMRHLLEKLEEALKKEGIFCAFSIARSQSFGMNVVLEQLQYQYRGRLINNCIIFENLENMNMWVKDLSTSS